MCSARRNHQMSLCAKRASHSALHLSSLPNTFVKLCNVERSVHCRGLVHQASAWRDTYTIGSARHGCFVFGLVYGGDVAHITRLQLYTRCAARNSRSVFLFLKSHTHCGCFLATPGGRHFMCSAIANWRARDISNCQR